MVGSSRFEPGFVCAEQYPRPQVCDSAKLNGAKAPKLHKQTREKAKPKSRSKDRPLQQSNSSRSATTTAESASSDSAKVNGVEAPELHRQTREKAKPKSRSKDRTQQQPTAHRATVARSTGLKPLSYTGEGEKKRSQRADLKIGHYNSRGRVEQRRAEKQEKMPP